MMSDNSTIIPRKLKKKNARRYRYLGPRIFDVRTHGQTRNIMLNDRVCLATGTIMRLHTDVFIDNPS